MIYLTAVVAGLLDRLSFCGLDTAGMVLSKDNSGYQGTERS